MACERKGGGAGALGDLTAVLGRDILEILFLMDLGCESQDSREGIEVEGVE